MKKIVKKLLLSLLMCSGLSLNIASAMNQSFNSSFSEEEETANPVNELKKLAQNPFNVTIYQTTINKEVLKKATQVFLDNAKKENINKNIAEAYFFKILSPLYTFFTTIQQRNTPHLFAEDFEAISTAFMIFAGHRELSKIYNYYEITKECPKGIDEAAQTVYEFYKNTVEEQTNNPESLYENTRNYQQNQFRNPSPRIRNYELDNNTDTQENLNEDEEIAFILQLEEAKKERDIRDQEDTDALLARQLASQEQSNVGNQRRRNYQLDNINQEEEEEDTDDENSELNRAIKESFDDHYFGNHNFDNNNQ